MPRGSQKYSKDLIFILLLIFLTFLPPSQELSFGWGGGGDDSKVKDVSGDASANILRKIDKKRVLQKKFKFHKIERIEVLDDDENDDDEVEDANGDTNENLTGEEINDNDTNEKTDDPNGDDDEEENDSERDRAASLNSENNDDEEEEFQFKRARKAEKKMTTKISEETSSKEKSKSFFDIFYLFGGDGSNESVKRKKRSKERSENESKEGNAKSNGIIDWLMWLGERTGRLKEATTESEEENVSTATSSGKPPKPISMPKSSSSKPSTKKRSETSAGAGGDDDGSYEEAISQESLDSLLRTLPNFVINPSEISEPECRQHLLIFQRQLRGHKVWTLQMLDSTGKVGNGLLRGNINQFGDFGVCTGIKTIVKVSASQRVRIRGKYCLAHIETQAAIAELKVPVHMLHGRGLFNSHLGNPSHFIPRYGVANWGVCVPSGCSGEVVQNMLQSSLQAYNSTGIEFHVEVNDNDCYVKHSKQFIKLMKKDKKFCATFLYILGLVLLAFASLIWEHWCLVKPILEKTINIFKNLLEKMKKKLDKSTTEMTDEKTNDGEDAKAVTEDESESNIQTTATEAGEEVVEESPQENELGETEEDPTEENLSLYHLAIEIFKSFSPQRTFTILLAPDSYDVQFPVFHVLKIAATFMLYLCLKFLMIGHMPIINRDQLVRTLDHPLSVLIRSPMLYADVLLLISGFLSAYQLSEEMEKRSYIHLLKRLGSKVSRYLPTVYLLICFQTWILPYLSSGPLWTNLVGQNSRLCDDQWWRNLLSLQNAIDFEETCSPSTIQLALEVQLYILAPLIVWLFYTDSDAGFFVYGALHAMSVAARFSRTNKEHLSMTLFHGINVSKFYRTANILYSSPISRATTYLLGIGAGIFQRTNQGIIDLTPEMIPFGWILACIGIFWCVWSPSAGMRTDFIYSSSDAASYASWCPLVFGLSLCWFIFMFPKSENSVIRFLLSSRPILVISRLVYPMQLVMYIAVLYNVAEIKESDKFHISDLINAKEIFQIFVATLIVSFLIDIPSKNIRRLLVNRIFIERSHQESEDQEPISGADPSEVSDELSENITSDTPEPPDTVWGSDPEEEEHKYLVNRRSSLEVSPKEVESNIKEEEDAEVEEDEEEEEISEADEVKKKPETAPPPSPPQVEKKPSEDDSVSYRRRRRQLSDD